MLPHKMAIGGRGCPKKEEGKSLFDITEKKELFMGFSKHTYARCLCTCTVRTSSKSWHLVCLQGFDGEDT